MKRFLIFLSIGVPGYLADDVGTKVEWWSIDQAKFAFAVSWTFLAARAIGKLDERDEADKRDRKALLIALKAAEVQKGKS